MAFLHTLIRPFGEYLVKPKKTFPPGSPRLSVPRKVRRILSVHEHQVEDLWIYDIAATPKQTSRRIYYFAGGGWQMPPSSQHWKTCSELARSLPNTTVSIVSYPLAPHSPAATAIPHLLRWFHTAITTSNEHITLMGDSAGANVILSLAISALQMASAPALKKIVVVSPAVDLSNTNPSQPSVEKYDPILNIRFVNSTGKAWASDWDRKDPRISPLYADVSVLHRENVHVYGITGGYDVLTPDALLFRDRLEEERVPGEWLEWGKQMHCFPLAFMYGLPESKDSFRWLLDKLS